MSLVHSNVARMLGSWSFCSRGWVSLTDAERLIVVAGSWVVGPHLATFSRSSWCPAAMHGCHLTVRLGLLEGAHVRLTEY